MWRVVTVCRQAQLGERSSSWASSQLRHLAAVGPRGGNRHLVAPKRKKQEATMELVVFVVVLALTAPSYRRHRVVTHSRRDAALQCGCPDACRSTMGDP